MALKPFVKFLYQISVNEKGQLFSSSTLNHPQGGIDLMVVTQGKVGFMSGSEVKGEESDIMLVGQQNRFFSFSFAPNTVLYGVVFLPNWCTSLVKSSYQRVDEYHASTSK